MTLIKTPSGIVYSSPSDEEECIFLKGKDWFCIIRYQSWHPMLPQFPTWKVDMFESWGEKYEGFVI